MLTPLKPSDVAKQEFVVVDIENDPTGRVILIVTAWKQAGDLQTFVCEGWGAWWPWIVAKAAEDKKFRTLHAHNGGGWDWLSLLEWLWSFGKMKQEGVKTWPDGSGKIVIATIAIGSTSLKLCDSYQILRSGLDKLAKKFCGRGKIDTGGRLPHELPKTLLYEYGIEDCVLLLEILEKTLAIIRERICKIPRLGSTIGATSMRIWRTMPFLKDSRGDPIELWMPRNESHKKLLREGYRGGRTEVFRTDAKIWENVNVYDTNAMYPSVMLDTPLPWTHRCVPVGDGGSVGECGVYRVKWRQPNRDIPPILCGERMEGSYAGEGVFFAPELRALAEFDPMAECSVIEGLTFFDTTRNLFREYVQKVYALRLEDRDGPLGEICKGLQNALYGKWGQKSEGDLTVCVKSTGELFSRIPSKEGLEISPVNRAGGQFVKWFGDERPLASDEDKPPVFTVRVNTYVPHEHVGIAGTITSAARVQHYRGLLAATRSGGELLYGDTDSVHIAGGKLPDSMVSDTYELGKYKVVTSGGRAVYGGRKMYAIQNSNGTEQIAAMGIHVGGNNGYPLDFAAFVARFVTNPNDKIGVAYRTAATFAEVVAGGKSCRMNVRERTL